MASSYPTVPGVYAGRSVAPRNVFKSGTPEFLPSLATIDGAKSRDPGNDDPNVLRAGLLMGKVTTGGKYRPAVIGLLTGAVAAGTVTSLTVAAPVATEVARLIAAAGAAVSLRVIGPPTAAGTVATQTVSATAASGTTITIASTTLAAAVVGSIVAPGDGSQVPTQVLTPQYGVDMVDHTGQTSIDATMRLLRSSDIDVTMIPNYASMDASVQAYVKASLKTNGFFSFSDDR